MRVHARMLTVAVVVLATGLAGACGGDDGGSAAPATTASAAGLQARLLTTPDVGARWKAGPAVTDADFGDAIQIPCEDMAINPTIAARLRPIAGVQFEPVDGSSAQLIEFALTGEPARLTADLTAYLEAFAACAAAPDTGPVAADPLALPTLGDQRGALTARATVTAGTTWSVRIAVVRTGATAIQIGLTEILSADRPTPQYDDAAFVALVRKATERVKA